jgi:hypothetical protein
VRMKKNLNLRVAGILQKYSAFNVFVTAVLVCYYHFQIGAIIEVSSL